VLTQMALKMARSLSDPRILGADEEVAAVGGTLVGQTQSSRRKSMAMSQRGLGTREVHVLHDEIHGEGKSANTSKWLPVLESGEEGRHS
jgi:hypothetical protein